MWPGNARPAPSAASPPVCGEPGEPQPRNERCGAGNEVLGGKCWGSWGRRARVCREGLCPARPWQGPPGEPGVQGLPGSNDSPAPPLTKRVRPSAVRLWRGLGCPVVLLCCWFPPVPLKKKPKTNPQNNQTKPMEFSCCLTCHVLLGLKYTKPKFKLFEKKLLSELPEVDGSGLFSF